MDVRNYASKGGKPLIGFLLSENRTKSNEWIEMTARMDVGKKVGLKVLAGIALISLLVGLGVCQGLDKFAITRPLNLAGATGKSEVTAYATSQGFSDFVTLAKKLGPAVVNDGREIKESTYLPIMVARTSVDNKVLVKVLRENKEVTLTVTIGELKGAPSKGKLG